MSQYENISINNIQSFLQSFSTDELFMQFLLSKGIMFTLEQENDMLILRYNKANPDCDTSDPFTRYCRGLVLEASTKKIVCFPPEKSIPYTSLNPGPFEDMLIEDFIDGTMINLFYKDQWNISTRSKIGANCRWFSDKNFSDMFVEAQGSLDFEKFETNFTYTFVLRHPENRIVTNYQQADLVLVQVRDMSTFQPVNTHMVRNVLKTRDVEVTVPVIYSFTDLDQLTQYVSQMNWEQQGLVLKYEGFRSKIRNEKYNYVKQMRGNTPKRFYNFLELRKNKMIKQYLQYFPEASDEFYEFTNKVNGMTRLLHQTYMDYRVKKTITIEEVPYELKPLIYDLHGQHLTNHIKVTFDYVKSYFNELPIPKIIFVVNFQKNLEIANAKALAVEESTEKVVDME